LGLKEVPASPIDASQLAAGSFTNYILTIVMEIAWARRNIVLPS